ncbi:hypothetical protein ANOM_008197 [Aspergillus nomiae NRRL 13137]|uniref:Uncharacterized protein n=1 Tax=Aspergillus nomiae NRRL (strain ATCC 15546 / NRRL 13137 / CBS 260.88 / M93) TaxID=1509407 RepID=A0A0L1IW90_ASPN3|nr:uncharacterized protein ANOM_008197 [Aspergillus nomiae NRRL 13137]KNG83675.1 hypothetical protein ANOM_008197 [Aspergillus nomiae NRRL 13137]
MNKQSLLNALIGVLNSTSVLRTGVQEPNTTDSTSLNATPTNGTLSTGGMSNCTQACALGGLVCVVALPSEANFCGSTNQHVHSTLMAPFPRGAEGGVVANGRITALKPGSKKSEAEHEPQSDRRVGSGQPKSRAPLPVIPYDPCPIREGNGTAWALQARDTSPRGQPKATASLDPQFPVPSIIQLLVVLSPQSHSLQTSSALFCTQISFPALSRCSPPCRCLSLDPFIQFIRALILRGNLSHVPFEEINPPCSLLSTPLPADSSSYLPVRPSRTALFTPRLFITQTRPPVLSYIVLL